MKNQKWQVKKLIEYLSGGSITEPKTWMGFIITFNQSNSSIEYDNDNSIGEEELKFKPSYPAKKYSSGQFRTLNNYGEGNEKKENIKNNKQFIHKSRVFNEDFSENE